jgi:hypothetical protein
LGFLGSSRFRGENNGLQVWILLDFLGFSRPNRDISKGYKRFSFEVFSLSVFP